MTSITELVNLYDKNCEAVKQLSLDSVAKIETPIFNSFSSLSKKELNTLLNKHHIKTTKSTHENCVLITILTDLVTCVIEGEDFYDELGIYKSKIINNVCHIITRTYFNMYIRISDFEEEQYLSFITILKRFQYRTKNEDIKQAIVATLRFLKDEKNAVKMKNLTPFHQSKLGASTILKTMSNEKKNLHEAAKLKQGHTKIIEKENINNNCLIKSKNMQTENDLTLQNMKKQQQNAFEVMMSDAKKKTNYNHPY